LNGIAKELKPKGFEVAAGAVNEDGNVPDFIKTYNPPFPVGKAGALNALEYLQWPPNIRPLVPFMVFIDRNGTIRAQFTGADTAFFDDGQEKNIREQAEKLLNESATPTKKKPKRKAPAE
jgi:hypothetical protein